MRAYGYRRSDYGRRLLYARRRVCPCCRHQDCREGRRQAKKRARRQWKITMLNDHLPSGKNGAIRSPMATQVTGVKCKTCGETVYSRARHDFRDCGCKAVAVDGGFDYLRVIGGEAAYEVVKLSVPVSPQELYDDWNLSADKWGRVPADPRP